MADEQSKALRRAARERERFLGEERTTGAVIGASSDEYEKLHEKTLRAAKKSGVEREVKLFFERTANEYKKMADEKGLPPLAKEKGEFS